MYFYDLTSVSALRRKVQLFAELTERPVKILVQGTFVSDNGNIVFIKYGYTKARNIKTNWFEIWGDEQWIRVCYDRPFTVVLENV